MPTSQPSPAPHALCLVQNFGHIRYLVNVYWTEKLYIPVVTTFISLLPSLQCLACFYSFSSPSSFMCWLGTWSLFFVQDGPKLGIRKWFHGRSYLALVMESDENEKDRADGILSVAVLLSILWSLKQNFPHSFAASLAGLERAGLELGYPDSSWDSAHHMFGPQFLHQWKEGMDWWPW